MSEQQKTTKKMYQRWWVWVIGLIVLFFVWNVGSNTINKARTKEIPNVMSINYTDAETVLKEQGFNVTSIESDAGSVLSNGSYNRSVKKGEVFKINDKTSPNYYEATKNKKVTIYYAKEDYTYNEPSKESTPTPTIAAAKSDNPVNSTSSSSSESLDWKQFLKDYEAWVDSYVEFMKKYKNNPTDASLIAEYGKLLSETAEWAEKSQKYENQLKEMSASDLGEYTKSITRILEKISSIAQ